MIELVVILIIAAVAMRSTYRTDKGVSDMPERIGARLGRLWEIAYQGMRENKLLRAEKALLTILKIDQKQSWSNLLRNRGLF